MTLLTPPSPALTSALDAAQAFPPEYAGGLSSHLPMALHALDALGADSKALAAFAASYGTKFDANRVGKVAAQHWPQWRAHLCEFEHWGAFRAHFAHALKNQSSAETLREVLPALWPGLGTAALHGLIRVAHAFEAQHAEELASALAYWAARWRRLPPQDHTHAMPLAQWWLELQISAQAYPSSFIAGRMAAAASGDAYRRLALALPQDSDALRPALEVFARHAAAHYVQSRHFTVLHLVTGSRAILKLLPFAPYNAQEAIGQTLTAALLTVALNGREPIAAPLRRALDGASDNIRSTFADRLSLLAPGVALDDHAIKLVHACWELAQADPDAIYLRCALRALDG